jgi:23S rRNA pseudouridine2605 synthase
MTNNIKLEKFLANSGLCSRRDAKQIILSGDITVDGVVICTPSYLLNEEQCQQVFYRNKKISNIEETLVYLYHKRAGLITSNYDDLGRETIFDDIPEKYRNLKKIGRLDKNTEGLILLTNNSQYAAFLENPNNNIARKYEVRIFGHVYQDDIDELANGITIDGMYYKSIIVTILEETDNNSWLEVTLTEGKNREIRNVFSYLGLKIKRLIRISYGEYQLGDISKGNIILDPDNIHIKYSF